MGLLLRRPDDLPPEAAYDIWFATTDAAPAEVPGRKWPDVAVRLEAAYDRCAETCWKIGEALSQEPGAEIARTPTMGAYGTDFRLMLAWVGLAEEIAGDAERRLMICDDPWLFRTVAALPGIDAGRPPRLAARRFRLRMRGRLSRARNAARLALTAIRLRGQKSAVARGKPSLLVYGHPGSSADGRDAYFGDLMIREPETQRLLHTDCPLQLARQLGSGNRAASLHAWGTPLFALSTAFTVWRPAKPSGGDRYALLLDRAAEVENSGAGPAMTRWQAHCQRRWIAACAPSAIVWPWENFAWERALCREAHRTGIPAIGYQHTVVGLHQLNFAARLNPDGAASLPDTIVCNGPAYRQELADWGHRTDAMPVGGAFRIARPRKIEWAPDAPVYFALSGLLPIARAQAAAARTVADSGRTVLFRDHPMYPIDIGETPTLRRAETGLLQQDRLSAVVYSTGTSGLEAVLAGIPTLRFLPDDRVAVQVLPAGVEVPPVTGENIVEALDRADAPPNVRWEEIFAEVDYSRWHSVLTGKAASV